MSQSKHIIFRAGGLIIVVAAGATLGAWLWEPGPPPTQPIAFNHRLHLEKAQGISCEDCHQFVTSQTYAGLPSRHICFGCHDPVADAEDAEADANQQRFRDLMRFAETDADIPWRRITPSRQYVFFSHRMHVTVADIDCQECHPTIASSTSPPTSGVTMFDMDRCLACHKQREASEDCISCHR